MRSSKIVAISFLMMLILAVMPTKAFAADLDSDGYDDYDFSKMQTFLNQPSAVAGKSNGQQLNAAYNPSDPTTWTGVVWTGTRIDKVGLYLSWSEKSLAGSLDVSGCTGITYLGCGKNEITSVNVSGCTSLQSLYCFTNKITSVNLTGCAALDTLNCSENLLTSINLSDNINLVNIYFDDNKLASLDLSALTELYNFKLQ